MSDPNEYTPREQYWETELAYYKRLYLEESAELERVQALPSMTVAEASTVIMRFAASVARGNPIDPQEAVAAVDQWSTYCHRQQAMLDAVRGECKKQLLVTPVRQYEVDEDFACDLGATLMAREILNVLDDETGPVCENCGDTGWQSEDPNYVPGGQSPCPLCDAHSRRLDAEVKT